MQFLRKIWGDFDGGYRCVVSGKKMRHTFFPDGAVKYPAKADVWYAPAIFSVEERKIPNVVAVKAFWLDIDCGKPGTYDTQVEAGTELLQFVEHYGLPMPSVVNSGNGLHVYWILDKHITPAEWHPIAGALKEACIEQNLRADHGITIDIARILRVPDTKNYKDESNPKPVSIVVENDPCTLEQMQDALGDLVFRAEIKRNAKSSNAVFAVDLPQTPKDADRIADQCAQLRAFRDTKGNLPEPAWYAGLGLLSLCVDGEQVAQAWSSGHPSYDPTATSAKLERAAEFAPTTCAKYGEVNPEGCVGCPFAGKITSPIQLGEVATPTVQIESKPAPAPDAVAVREIDEDGDIPIPQNYQVVEGGVFEIVPGDEDDAPKRHHIFTHAVWVSRVFVGEIKGQSEIEISWVNSDGVVQNDIVPNKEFATDRQAAAFFRGNNIRFKNIKLAMRYIDAAIDLITRRHKESIVFSRFGMHEAGFVVGTDLVKLDGKIVPTRISSRVTEEDVKKLCVKGSQDEWIRATALFDQPQFWMHRYAILAILASPINAFLDNGGSVLSIAGESGGGKTVAASIGAAAYGHYKGFEIGNESTLNGFYTTWEQSANLPVLCHEADQLANLIGIVYAAANGDGRTTSTQEGTKRKKGGWRLLSVFTSNMSLLSMPQGRLNDATRARILELPVEAENRISLEIGREVMKVIERNHGHVGRKFLSYVMTHRDEIGQAVQQKTDEYIKSGIHDTLRFGLWQVAAAEIAGRVCKSLGLIEFEIDDAIENALATLRSRTVSAVDPMQKVADFINDYTNTYHDSIGRRVTKTGIWMEEPRGEARGKWRLDEGGNEVDLCIAITPFTAAALAEGIDTNYIKRWMKENKVTAKPERLASAAGAVRSYVIPADRIIRNEANNA